MTKKVSQPSTEHYIVPARQLTRRTSCCSRWEWCCWVLRHSSHWSRSLSSAIACRW
jgi:hypothetical protein